MCHTTGNLYELVMIYHRKIIRLSANMPDNGSSDFSKQVTVNQKKKSTFFSKQRESAKEKLCAIFPTRISLFKSWKVGEFLWFLASVKPWLHQPKWPHRTHGFPWDPRQPRPKRPRSRSWRCVNRENPRREVKQMQGNEISCSP